MNEALTEFYKHNLWANMRLLDVCATLTDDQLDLNAPGTYGSVRNTLVHLAGAEIRYVARLRGEEPDNTVIHETKDFPGISALQESLRRTGESLIRVAEEFDAKQILRGTWRGEPYELPAIIVMLQAINHATEHRMHIVGILNQNGIETPDMDGWAYNER